MTDDRAALVEKVAKAIYECWCSFHAVTDTSMPWAEVEGDERDLCRAEATAAIDLIRAEVLEEAARVADDHVFGGAGVAAAIRALKSTP